MSYLIETINEEGAVKALPARYPDLKRAVSVARRLHELEHRELDVTGSNGVRVSDPTGKIVWERTTSHDYLGLD